ncbi:MAG: hypothetical protein ACLFR7_08475 [Opitutales bacterium]
MPLLSSSAVEKSVNDIAITPDDDHVVLLTDSQLIVEGPKGGTYNIGGDFLALHPDGRRAFVASGNRVTEIALHPHGKFENGGLIPAGGKIESHSVPGEGDITAMAVRPDGETLFVITEKKVSGPRIFNQILETEAIGAENDAPPSTIAIAGLDVSGEVVKREFYEQPQFSAPRVLEGLTLHDVSDMAVSPDGNIAIVSVKGTQGGRATPFGYVPTSDEWTGGVLVFDLNTMEKIDHVPTSLPGEDTARVRRELAATGATIQHPWVTVTERISSAAGAAAAVGGSVSVGAIGPTLHTQAAVAAEAHSIMSDAYEDYGAVEAYRDLYPNDMVGASGVGISNRGDMALVSMFQTNNFGVMPLSESDAIRGFGSGSLMDFAIRKATEKTINGYSYDGLGTNVTFAKRPTEYMGPREIAFAPEDTHALVGMSGGVPGGEDSRIGLIDLREHRGALLGGTATPSSDFLKLPIPGGHDRPMQVAAYHAPDSGNDPKELADSDGDSLSDHVEAFNRWNDFKRVYFGDKSVLASTNQYNITSPSSLPRQRVYPTDLSDQGYFIPHSGLGYRFNYNGHLKHSVNVGSATAVSTIERVGRRWHQEFLEGSIGRPYFVILDMSHPGGGLVRSKSGELLHFNTRNGFQANFAYLKPDSDETHDFVTSNGPRTPLDNSGEDTVGYDQAATVRLIEFLAAEPTVAAIVVDPLVAAAVNHEKILARGVAGTDSLTRRDHDNFFRVIFAEESGIRINVDDTVRIPTEADGDSQTVYAIGGEGREGPYGVTLQIQDPGATHVRITEGQLFYDRAMQNPVEAGYIEIAKVNGLLWTAGNSQGISVTTYRALDEEGNYEQLNTTSLATRSVSVAFSAPQGVQPTQGVKDGVPLYACGFNLDGLSGSGDQNRDRLPDALDDQAPLAFTPFSLGGIAVSGSADPVVRIDYDASFPSAVSRSVKAKGTGLEVDITFALPDTGALRIWAKEGGAARDGEDFIAPGAYRLSELPDTLYLEAVTAVKNTPIEIAVDPDGFEGPLGFVAKRTEYVNREAGLVTVDTDRIYASQLATAKNGKPDYLAFDGAPAIPFAKLTHGFAAAHVALDYSASDPDEIDTIHGFDLLPAGHLRLWKNAGARSEADFVKPGVQSDLPSTLHIEAVAPGVGLKDQKITLSALTEFSESPKGPVGGLGISGLATVIDKNVTPGYRQSAAVEITALGLPFLDNFAPDAHYRKFDLNGQPVADPTPEQMPQRDTLKDGFYVDGYSLIPTLSVEDLSIPLIGGNLSMGFRRTASVDTMLTVGGDAVEPVGPDRVLGPGWRSSIGSRVVVKDGIFTLYDLNGQAHRFSKSGQPIPASFMEASSHRMELTINEDELNPDLIHSVIWTRNYWTECYYEAYAPEASQFGDQPVVGQLLRLKYIKDKNGNGIEYVYADAGDAHPASCREAAFERHTWNINKTFDAKRIAFTYVDGRLDTLTDPMGNVFDYDYTEGRLSKITFPPVEGATGAVEESFAYQTEPVPLKVAGKQVPGVDTTYVALSRFTNRNGNTVHLDYALAENPWSLDAADGQGGKDGRDLILAKISSPLGAEAVFTCKHFF